MDDFWDKRASVLVYHEALRSKKVKCTNDLNDKMLSNDEIYDLALERTGHIKFDQLTYDLAIDDYFADLSNKNISTAIAFGLLGTMLATFFDIKGDAVESKILQMNKEYLTEGTTSPSDYRMGKNHRHYFGHDIFNPFQKLPEGYLFNGNMVGGKNLYEMYTDTFCPNSHFLLKPIKTITQMLAHYISDLPTIQGLPIPGSSYFTKWAEAPLRASGFSSENQVMSTLGKEYGSVHLSDISTTALIALLLTSYKRIFINKLNISNQSKELLSAQLAVIAYGTGVIAQLGMMVTGVKLPSAKLNLILTIALSKNIFTAAKLLHLEHSEIMSGYENSLSMLKCNSMDFEEWVKIL